MFTLFWKKHEDKIISIAKGAVVACTGAFVSYIIPVITSIEIPEQYIPLEVAVLSVLVNILRKYGVQVVGFGK